MPSPFPGMDPYLENPQTWRGTHLKLLSEMHTQLNRTLGKGFAARLDVSVYLVDDGNVSNDFIVPDIALTVRPRKSDRRGAVALAEPETPPIEFFIEREVQHRSISVLQTHPRRVLTVIELLSPSNKAAGSDGFKFYHKKRQTVINSRTNLVEIDLLRAGTPTVPASICPPCDYRAVVLRPQGNIGGRVWPIRLEQKLPSIPIPIRDGVPEVRLNLQNVVNTIYEDSLFDELINYSRDPEPPFTPEQAKWARKLLKARR